jgi:hypothetical protein
MYTLRAHIDDDAAVSRKGRRAVVFHIENHMQGAAFRLGKGNHSGGTLTVARGLSFLHGARLALQFTRLAPCFAPFAGNERPEHAENAAS